MEYIFLTIMLFVSMFTYFKIADRYNIVDKPNNRSSHIGVIIRGGGIVYLISLILYIVFSAVNSTLSLEYGAIAAAISLTALISFIDDIRGLSPRVRLIVQLASMCIIFYGIQSICIENYYSILYTIPALIFFIGAINAYNFMDGINGITGVYSLVILGCMQFINYNIVNFTDYNFIWYPIIASLVFLFFNFRKKAKCFAGDVGSVTIAFWVITLLLQLMLKTESIIYVLFLAVYGVDTILTIVHRIYLKQNIFEAHRLHFFQILANEKKKSHLAISIGYALVQLLICAFVIYSPLNLIVTALITLLPLILLYCLKFRMLASHHKTIV